LEAVSKIVSLRHEFVVSMSNSIMEVFEMPRFRDMPQDPSQMWLMPPSLDEMVSEDNEVRVLSEVMDQLDWSILESTYFDRGTPAYPPKVMTKIKLRCFGNLFPKRTTL